MEIKVKHLPNSEVITYNTFGDVTYNRKLSDELSSLVFTIKSETPLPFKKYDAVLVYQIIDMMVFDVNYDKTKYFYYYNIIAIEPTKLLDEIVLNGYAESGRVGTVYTMFENLITRLEEINEISDISISNDLEDILITKNAEEFVFDGFVTAREIFDSYSSLFDIRVNLSYWSSLRLEVFDLNTKGSLITLKDTYASDLEAEYQTKKMVSIVDNVYGSTCEEPYKKLTSDTAFFNYDDAFLMTNYKINKVKSLLLKGRLSYYQISTTTITNKDVSNIPLTNALVDKKLYDALEVEEKYTKLYFEQNNNKVSGFLANAQTSWLSNEVVIDLVLTNLLNTNIDFRNVILSRFGVSYTSGDKLKVTTNYYDDLTFSIDYEPVEKLYFEASENEDDFVFNTKTIDNQTESKVNLNRYIASLNSKYKRVGNRSIVVEYNDHSGFELGDYTSENYIVSGIEMAYSGNTTKYKYTLTENYNAINTAYKINRENRIYNIELNDFIDIFIPVELGDFNNYNHVRIKTSAMVNWVDVPILKYNNKYCIKMIDNYSIGMNQSTIDEHIENNFIPYVDSNGEFTSISMIFHQGINDSIPNYPYVTSGDYNGESTEKIINLKKDMLERLILVIGG